MNILSFHTIIDPWQQGRIMLARFNSWGGGAIIADPGHPSSNRAQSKLFNVDFSVETNSTYVLVPIELGMY